VPADGDKEAKVQTQLFVAAFRCELSKNFTSILRDFDFINYFPTSPSC
jgi:hypothetical protein